MELEALLSDFFRQGDRSDDPDGGSNRQFEDNYVDLSKVINMEIDEEVILHEFRIATGLQIR